MKRFLVSLLLLVLVSFTLSATNPALAAETKSTTVELTYVTFKLEYPSSAYPGDIVNITITGWSKETQGTVVTKVSVKFVGFTTSGEYASYEKSWSSEQGVTISPEPSSETFKLPEIQEDLAAGYTVTQIEVTYADPQRGTEASDWFPTIFIESPYHKLYDEATKEIQNLKSQLAEAQKGSGELETELEDLKSENLALQNELSQVKKQNDDLKTENSELQKKLDAANTQIENLKSELTKAQADYEKLQSRNKELQTSVNSLQLENNKLKTEIETLKSKNSQLQENLSSLQNDLNSAKTQQKDLEAKLAKTQTDYKALQSQNIQLQRDLETAQKDLKSAQGELTAAQNLMFTFIGTTIIAAVIAGVLGLKRKKT